MHADSAERLQRFVNDSGALYNRRKSEVNVSKRKAITDSENKRYDVDVVVNEERMEQVICFAYQGADVLYIKQVE